jgi:hypothetical protein
MGSSRNRISNQKLTHFNFQEIFQKIFISGEYI